MSFQFRDKILCAFTASVLLVCSFSYWLFQTEDPSRCKVLMKDGFWLNPSELLNWQPEGCMMHTYQSQEAALCLKGRRVIFLGGNDTITLFDHFARRLDPKYKLPKSSSKRKSLSAISDVHLEYVRDSKLESAELREIGSGFNDGHSRPALAVIGLDHERLRSERNLEPWAAHVGSVISDLKIDAAGRALKGDRVVIIPMLRPNYTQLGRRDRDDFLTPERIGKMNEILPRLNIHSSVDVAYAFNQVAKGPGALVDGIVPVPQTVSVFTDILLNLRCNSQLPKHYPYASTCCNTYPSPSWVQVVGFILVAVLLPIAMVLKHRGYTMESSLLLRILPASKYHGHMLVVGLIVTLCYYYDRTNVFAKAQKQTSPSQFFILGGIVTAASLYTSKTSEKELAFLNRDQTDEWKGWMQVAILIYHYLGVSKTPYIYHYIRVAVTSYLFMTGFGHTVYFLRKDEFSLKRFVATMLRLNFLNVVLAYAMGNDWLLYYFAPLVSWNFLVIYGIYWFGHDRNVNRKFVYIKMVIGALLNTAFYQIPGVLEFAWSVLGRLFRMQGDMKEWRFRATLDLYSTFPGMIAGVLFSDWGTYALPKSPSWPYVQTMAIVASAMIMLGYTVFEVNQPSKASYNAKHPYIGWLPCCAFVVLRNSSSWLRRTHNVFFAWIGRCSLETFILQFHLWLAADTAGLLVLGPPHLRAIKMLVTTIIFIWLASLVTISTGPIVEWIMGVESRSPAPALPMSLSSAQVAGSSRPDNSSSAEVGKDLCLTVGETDAIFEDAVPINGAPVDLNSEVPREMIASGGFAKKLTDTTKDLRVRIGLVLVTMAFLNWTYYI